MAQFQTIIVIREEAFGARFDVEVSPSPADNSLAREFVTLEDARKYARRLAIAYGWAIADLSGEAAAE